jgi:hypothetical protein
MISKMRKRGGERLSNNDLVVFHYVESIYNCEVLFESDMFILLWLVLVRLDDAHFFVWMISKMRKQGGERLSNNNLVVFHSVESIYNCRVRMRRVFPPGQYSSQGFAVSRRSSPFSFPPLLKSGVASPWMMVCM